MLIKIEGEVYLLECQSYDDGFMAVRIVKYVFTAAGQFATWYIGHTSVPMPRFFVIYVKGTDKTPKTTTITFTFPDRQTMDYKSNNVIMEELRKKEIVRKKLFPYIPFYVARYEGAIVFEGAVNQAVNDLIYFRDEMIRLHRENDSQILK